MCRRELPIIHVTANTRALTSTYVDVTRTTGDAAYGVTTGLVVTKIAVPGKMRPRSGLH
jgi:hypothetical protein